MAWDLKGLGESFEGRHGLDELDEQLSEPDEYSQELGELDEQLGESDEDFLELGELKEQLGESSKISQWLDVRRRVECQARELDE